MEEKFSIRKTKIAVGSVLIATVFGIGGQMVSADSWVANSPSTIKIAEGATSYTLKYGDTLWAVSQVIDIPVEALAQLNNIDLTTGQQYHLPVGYVIKWSADKSKLSLTDAEGNVQKELQRTADGNYTVVTSSKLMTVDEVLSRIESIQTENGLTTVKLKDGQDLQQFLSDIQNVPSESLDDKQDDKQLESPITVEGDVVKDTFNGADRVTLINPKNGMSSNFVLIESNGHYGLLDAGTSGAQKDYETVTGYLKKLGVETFDFVVVSHLDIDHMSTLATNAGNEKTTLFNDFTVKKLYIKNPENTTNYRIAPSLKISGKDFYDGHVAIYNNIIDNAKKTGTEVVTVEPGSQPSFDLGDFNIKLLNTESAKDDEKGNYWANLDSLVELVTKVDSKGDTYNMLVANDLEGYDIPETIQQLKDLGVDHLDVYELNHHGFSSDQAQAKDIPQTFGTPVTVVTNTESTYSRQRPERYSELKETYTNGLYWQGEGSVQVDFSNTEAVGVVVKQENNVNYTAVKVGDASKEVIQGIYDVPQTEEDLTVDGEAYMAQFETYKDTSLGILGDDVTSTEATANAVVESE
ncbi:signal peptide-containing protein, YSIRK family [Streptococcus henryi]|uniref:Signal peptide-containing protein, YSIRK family n=1 Tax=Streptococcus henryi TaxID=439219 RepID=A0A1G5ZZY6_9STRE|nr:LysM peptidoglycan-binding domain-containing protein [Streptococcus henryi]SDB01759.1 signal peptide-containing protein, YSIRK family [Streptococcus henryi]